MFLWRNKQTYPLIIMKYPPYLLHCQGLDRSEMFIAGKQMKWVFDDNLGIIFQISP